MFQRISIVKRSMFSLAVAALFFAAVQARADGPMANCYVLAVGIDTYAQSSLKGCANDARAVSKLFKSQQGKVFGQVASRIVVDAEASRDRIGQELATIQTKGKAGDFVVLFFSGHGSREPRASAGRIYRGNVMSCPFFVLDSTSQPAHDVSRGGPPSTTNVVG